MTVSETPGVPVSASLGGGGGDAVSLTGTTSRGTGFTVHPGANSARTVLLSNSLGAQEDSWRELVALLTPTSTVITYDHRGHGRSSHDGPFDFETLVDDAVAVLEEAPATGAAAASTGTTARAHWCGVSLGGMIGVAVASRRPDLIVGLTALSAPARQPDPEFWRSRARAVRERGMAVATDGVAGRWFSAAFRERQPARVEEIVAELAALDPDGYAAVCEAMADGDVRHDATLIRVPTTYVAGRRDVAVDPRNSQILAAATASCALHQLDGGHMLGIEQAPYVAELVTTSLAQAAAHTVPPGDAAVRRSGPGEREHPEKDSDQKEDR